MTRIDSSCKMRVDGREEFPSFSAATQDLKYHSSLRFGQAEEEGLLLKIFRKVSFPFQFIGTVLLGIGKFLGNIFCCSYGQSSIDWEETKKIFVNIRAAVTLTQRDLPSRQKDFNEALKELSPAAKERFCQHIGFVLAERQPLSITGKLEQLAWYKENRSLIEFDKDYFSNISENEVLSTAVDNFNREIKEHTSKKGEKK